jgi:hypothetical protein
MTNIAITTPRDGDTVREVRRALNALGVFQISDAAIITRGGDARLQVPDAYADQAFTVLRNAGIHAIRVR